MAMAPLSSGVTRQLSASVEMEVEGLRRENAELTTQLLQLQASEERATRLLDELRREHEVVVSERERERREAEEMIKSLRDELEREPSRAGREEAERAEEEKEEGSFEEREMNERVAIALKKMFSVPDGMTSPSRAAVDQRRSNLRPQRGSSAELPPPDETSIEELPTRVEVDTVMLVAQESKQLWSERLHSLELELAQAARDIKELKALRVEYAALNKQQVLASSWKLDLLRLELESVESVAYPPPLGEHSDSPPGVEESRAFHNYVELRRLAHSLGYSISPFEGPSSVRSEGALAGRQHMAMRNKLPPLPLPCARQPNDESFAAMQEAMRTRWYEHLNEHGSAQMIAHSPGDWNVHPTTSARVCHSKSSRSCPRISARKTLLGS